MHLAELKLHHSELLMLLAVQLKLRSAQCLHLAELLTHPVKQQMLMLLILSQNLLLIVPHSEQLMLLAVLLKLHFVQLMLLVKQQMLMLLKLLQN